MKIQLNIESYGVLSVENMVDGAARGLVRLNLEDSETTRSQYFDLSKPEVNDLIRALQMLQ